MAMKIKLTQEQADFIEKSLANGIDKEEMLNRFAEANCFEKQPRHSLHGLCVMDLARALLIGYEIKEELTLEIGQWKRYRKNYNEIVVGQVSDYDAELTWVRFDGSDTNVAISNVLGDATPEEIAEEKERRLWNSIGRGVGKFKDGDIGIARNGASVMSEVVLEIVNAHGDLAGFYPIESFVNLGEVEVDE